MSNLLLYILIGKLIIFLAQKFPFQNIYFIGRLFKEGRFLRQLFDCDLCLGTWVYPILNFAFGVDLFYEYFEIPILNVVLTGMAVSFLMHIFSLGWNAKFREFVIE